MQKINKVISLSGKILQKAVEKQDIKLVKKSMELLHLWQNKHGYNKLVQETLVSINSLMWRL